MENDLFVVPFTLHSDSIARMEVVLEIEYTRQKSVLPPEIGEVIRPFTYEPISPNEDELLTVVLLANARVVPEQTTMQVAGTFEPSRIVWGPKTPVEEDAVVPVSSACAQAQPIVVEKDVAVTAVDLLLEPLDQTTRISITILDDADGKPFGKPLLSQPAALRLDREVNGELGWVSARLPAEFQFRARGKDGSSRRYWLVVTSAEGDANWAVQSQQENPVGIQCSQDDGLSWQATRVTRLPGAVAGIFRLRHTPAQYQVPLQLQVGEGEQAQMVNLDRFQPLGRVDFTLDSVDLAAAMNQYMDQTVTDTCPEEEHLANGDFTDWQTISNAIGPTKPILLNRQPTVVAVSPDCQWIVVGNNNSEVFLSFLILLMRRWLLNSSLIYRAV